MTMDSQWTSQAFCWARPKSIVPICTSAQACIIYIHSGRLSLVVVRGLHVVPSCTENATMAVDASDNCVLTIDLPNWQQGVIHGLENVWSGPP